MASAREPLLGDVDAAPALLSGEPLSARQQRLDDRLKTLCLCILSTCAILIGCYYLRTILIRFVLAVAVYYLLEPIIEVLSVSTKVQLGGVQLRCRVPRALAILMALLIAGSIMAILGMIIAHSIGTFAAHSDVYGKRVEQLIQAAMDFAGKFSWFGFDANSVPAVIAGGKNSSSSSAKDGLQKTLADLAKENLSLTQLILGLLGTAAAAVENVVYILLFLAFLLAGSKPRSQRRGGGGGGGGGGGFHVEVDEQIFTYIRGKVGIALLVAVGNAVILGMVGLNLWLAFGVITFWLNFIPNVGMAIAVCLPLPLVLLDPQFGAVGIMVAFFGPLGVGMIAKDVIEPLVIGHSTSLTPVAVLLAVMIWGSVWGITGMVLAVPMTAVLRIYLQGLEHPLTQKVALVLAGRDERDGAGAIAPI